VTPETVGLLIRHGSGVICAAMAGELCDKLDLPPMREKNEDYKQTAYTISCDVREGTTTGISAADRATTLAKLAHPETQPNHLARPGHVFPLRAKPGGVLERDGHTEAGVDLTRLAGLPPVAAIVEMVHDDGTMVRLHEVQDLIRRHSLPEFEVITIADLKAHRQAIGDIEPLAESGRPTEFTGPALLPTKDGNFNIYAWRMGGRQHVALVMGDVRDADDVLVRMHSECLTGDALGSLRCDCGPQLQLAKRRIAKEGKGVIIYLDGHEGRGIGIFNKVAAYTLQDEGMDTYAANLALGFVEDDREYSAAARILDDMGVHSVRLLTNNPNKLEDLRRHGVDVRDDVPLVSPRNPHNEKYLDTKASKGHVALAKKISKKGR
ncbi:MAG: GTP cyclohydrolase II, partial [Acidobacteriota bacterium]